MNANDQPVAHGELIARYEAVRQRIADASHNAGRDPACIKLVAVSKTFSADDIRPLLAHGHRCFGENRVQEAMAKWPKLREQFPDLELHLIGPLQTNKTREAVRHFDVIQTLDREKLASSIAVELAKQARDVKLLIQVNTGLEAQKAGVGAVEAEAFLASCREKYGLNIYGLMCIPPVDAEPSPHFDELRHLATRLRLADISMGMSGDYERAIACGATIVRVGSAIFGAR